MVTDSRRLSPLASIRPRQRGIAAAADLVTCPTGVCPDFENSFVNLHYPLASTNRRFSHDLVDRNGVLVGAAH